MPEPTFGHQTFGARPVDVLLAEAREGRGDRFVEQEALLARALKRAAAGQRVLAISYGERGARDTVEILGLSEHEQAYVDEQYSLARQEARGAWFLQQELSIKPGLADLGWHMKSHPRFAMNGVRDEVAKVDLRTSPDALASWALIAPFFDALFEPLDLSTAPGKPPTREQKAKAWAEIDDRYGRLGLSLDDALAPFRPGGGWSGLRIADQGAARQRLVNAIFAQASRDTVRRWRAVVVERLAGAFYKKAKGARLARYVLTKALHPHLAAYFAGDWLALLEYLGEQPADGETVITTLPETKLFVGAGSSRIADVAAQHGLASDEVERMLGAFLGQHAGTSPVEERVDVMRRWWHAYDAVHAAQKPGMPSLWGLVEEALMAFGGRMASAPGLYRRLLPADVVNEVDRLWEGVTLARWPERIVSEFYPHRQMAQAFGPALELWNGLALTCWFVCEGPYSRTSLGELGGYHERQIKVLEDAGFPVDRAVFQELEEAERRLGPIQQIWEDRAPVGGADLTISVQFGRGQRREGFEILRDIVTRHRRAWTDAHLDGYLRYRWDSELRSVAQEYNRRLAGKGKPPTFKQFASFATATANHWFNGDLGAVFASFGERAPAATERIDLLAGDPLNFVAAIYRALGGTDALPEDAAWKDRESFDRNWQAGRLAAEATRYLQLHEALARPPEPKEFGADKLSWEALGGIDIAWRRYVEAIEVARKLPPRPPGPPAQESPEPFPPTPRTAVEAAPDTAVPQAPGPGSPVPPPAVEEPKRRGFLGRLWGR